MTISELAPETGSDDIVSIDDDIDNLKKRFITPIDNIRSNARPAISQQGGQKNSGTDSIKNDFKNLQIDNIRPLESRAHAFYRMLGLPVVGSNDSFYNPGFDPSGAKTSEKRQAVNSNFVNNFKPLVNLISFRETLIQEQRKIFARQDLDASLYALLLKLPMPFNVLDSGKSSLEEDMQRFTIDARGQQVTWLAEDNEDLSSKIIEAGEKFKTRQKILKPFIVDPRIENTVTPDLHKICVPFLKDKKSTKIHTNNFLNRPGIELIIRQRLNESGEDLNFLKNVENIIENKKTAGVDSTFSDRQTIVDTLSALSDSNEISDSTKAIFTGVTSQQVITITGLIKTIKAVIIKLTKAISIITNAEDDINWVPIPSEEGPESGPLKAKRSNSGFKISSSKLDKKITELGIKKLNAERQVQNFNNLGEFASPFNSNSNSESVKKYNEEYDDLIQKIDSKSNEAFIAMGHIEIITGEISGLGLIDILAIYTALWSIDLGMLINLLDEDAFKRMYNFNPEFRGNTDVDSRFPSNPRTISSVLNALEEKVINILSFADKVFKEQLSSPADRGD